MIFMEILVFGLFKGAIYALIAVGFTLIFGVARVINLGHGTFYMLGAYLTYVFIAYAGLNPFLSLAISAIVVGFVGVSMDYILIRPMREMGAYVTVVTLAFALLSQYIIFAIFGSRARNIPDFVTGNVVVFGVNVANQRLFVLFLATATIIAFGLFLKNARFGKAIRAVAQNPDASQLMGVEPGKVFAITVGIAASMAGPAGGAISPIWNVEPTMWLFPLIKAFSIVVLGGIGSLPGSIIGAFILGFAETATAFLISNYLQNMVSLIIIVLVLLIKPSGLMGRTLRH